MAQAHILLVDAGNTRSTFALALGRRILLRDNLTAQEATPAALRTRLGIMHKQLPIGGAIIGSVVPRMTKRWQAAVAAVLGLQPLIVRHTLDLGVALRYPHPERIGADRLANAVGALIGRKPPVVVLDFGTALTFDIISERGYEGGIIAPGLPLMFNYLHERTALLPHIETGPVRRMTGRSTEEAMRIGTRYGYRGMVREILDALLGEIGEPPPSLMATGGDARWVCRGLDYPIRYDANLTLRGLLTIYRRNTPS